MHQDQAFIIPDTQNVVKFGLGWSCARNFDMDAAVLLLGNSGGGSVEAIASLEAPPSAWGHIDPRTNTVQPFSEVDNKLILDAQQRGDSRVRIGDVALPNGAVLHFEVRFNDQGKLTTMPASRMVQVNLGNGNTREIKVLREGPPPAAATGGAPPPSYDQPPPAAGPAAAGPVDLDAQCVMYDRHGGLVDACYFNRVSALSGAVVHSGDSLDGSGKDAEVITIWLDRLPAEVEYFAFVVSRHAGGGFQDAVGARVELRSVSKAAGGGGSVAAITSQDLRKIQPGSDTLIFAVVHRSYSAPGPAGPPGADVSAGEWQAKEVLQLAQGRNFQECKVSTTACVVSLDCHVWPHTDALCCSGTCSSSSWA